MDFLLPAITAALAAVASLMGQIIKTAINELKLNPKKDPWEIIFTIVREKLFQSESKSETLDSRVEKLTVSLKDATSLINQIESEIKIRAELAENLKSDIERTKEEIAHYENLAKVSEQQAEALAAMLRGELAKEGRTNFWKGVLVNFIFFILGAAASWGINLLTMPKSSS